MSDVERLIARQVGILALYAHAEEMLRQAGRARNEAVAAEIQADRIMKLARHQAVIAVACPVVRCGADVGQDCAEHRSCGIRVALSGVDGQSKYEHAAQMISRDQDGLFRKVGDLL